MQDLHSGERTTNTPCLLASGTSFRTTGGILSLGVGPPVYGVLCASLNIPDEGLGGFLGFFCSCALISQLRVVMCRIFSVPS